MKNKSITILGVILVIVGVLGGASVSSYNSIISLEEKVNTAQADVSVQLQRRADLIPNLINTVKGYMKHEDDVIQKVLDAREKVASANSVAELNDADKQLSAALTNLNVVIENYPDLKASENFIGLQDEIAGSENRVATARKDYNDAAKEYNTKIKTFPSMIFANMMNKESKEYFEANEEGQKVPVVDFSE